MTITDLYKIILERKQTKPEGSYTSSLLKEGTQRISQKVGEEAVEVVIASNSNNKQRTVEESADLLFHLLVLLVQMDITPEEIFEELEKRHTAKKQILDKPE